MYVVSDSDSFRYSFLPSSPTRLLPFNLPKPFSWSLPMKSTLTVVVCTCAIECLLHLQMSVCAVIASTPTGVPRRYGSVVALPTPSDTVRDRQPGPRGALPSAAPLSLRRDSKTILTTLESVCSETHPHSKVKRTHIRILILVMLKVGKDNNNSFIMYEHPLPVCCVVSCPLLHTPVGDVKGRCLCR